MTIRGKFRHCLTMQLEHELGPRPCSGNTNRDAGLITCGSSASGTSRLNVYDDPATRPAGLFKGLTSNSVTNPILEVQDKDTVSRFSVDAAGTTKINSIDITPAVSTYVPTLTCGTGTATIGSGDTTLSVTRSGTITTIRGLLYISAVSTPSGTLRISLPYTVAALAENADVQPRVIYVHTSVSLTVNGFMIYTEPGTANAGILTANGSTWGAAAGQLKVGTYLMIFLSYQASA